jgi:Zn-dependent membrane protease YugP
MAILGLIGAVLLLLCAIGPKLWVDHALKAAGDDRPDLPGTGAELARHLLDEAGLHDVTVEQTDQGDHYDPVARVVRLTAPHHDGRSVAAVAVAAHEVAHAVQHARDEPDFRRRVQLVRIIGPLERAAQVTMIALPVVLILSRSPVLGLLMFALGLALLAGRIAVHAVTLPVEFDASFRKALPVLETGYLAPADIPAARRVLRAAALTYVSAALISLLNVVRWVRP